MSETEIYGNIVKIIETTDSAKANSLINDGWRLLLICKDIKEMITADDPQYYQLPNYILGLPKTELERNTEKHLD